MERHQIEEAVNQGRGGVSVTLDGDCVRTELAVPEGGGVAWGTFSRGDLLRSDGKAETSDGSPLSGEELRRCLQRAYENLFNDIESRYHQKLCYVTGLAVSGGNAGELVPVLCADAAAGEDGTVTGTLTGDGARLLDPRGNLRAGVPVTFPAGE